MNISVFLFFGQNKSPCKAKNGNNIFAVIDHKKLVCHFVLIFFLVSSFTAH